METTQLHSLRMPAQFICIIIRILGDHWSNHNAKPDMPPFQTAWLPLQGSPTAGNGRFLEHFWKARIGKVQNSWTSTVKAYQELVFIMYHHHPPFHVLSTCLLWCWQGLWCNKGIVHLGVEFKIISCLNLYISSARPVFVTLVRCGFVN